jgi:hypothetical protein
VKVYTPYTPTIGGREEKEIKNREEFLMQILKRLKGIDEGPD